MYKDTYVECVSILQLTDRYNMICWPAQCIFFEDSLQTRWPNLTSSSKNYIIESS